jgi:DNA-binding MarR family transcriptional regulator
MFVHEQLIMCNETPKPLGVQIRQTSNAIKHYIDLRCSAVFPVKLTGIEGLTIGYVYRHPNEEITATSLMVAYRTTKATLSQTLKGLVAKGLIVATPKKGDKRVKVITLTDKGTEFAVAFRQFMAEISKELEVGISPEDKEAFIRVLNQLKANAGWTDDQL